MSDIILYDYWRSTAGYRVRIALNLKGVDYERVAVDLVAGEQRESAYRGINPQGRVPTLVHGGAELGQSLAIIDYLDAVFPEPLLTPADPVAAAQVRAMAQIVACDIHPLNNLSILQYLSGPLGLGDEAKATWYAHWIHEGFAGLEQMAKDHGGAFLSGDTPGLADICLVGQMYNARRFDVSVDNFPALVDYDAKASALEPFAAAHPDNNKP